MGKTKISVIGEARYRPVPGEAKEEKKPITTESVESAEQESAKSADARKPRQRGKKYLAARAKIDPQKSYSPQEAARLARETSTASFDEAVELHLVLFKNGLSTTVQLPHSAGNMVQLKSEKSAPLVHTTIAKVSQPEREIEENLEAVIGAVGPKNIKKAVISASMGPGVRVALS